MQKSMKPILISFSGGKTSAKMAKDLMDEHSPELILCFWSASKPYKKRLVSTKTGQDIVIVFCNTGKEKKATLDFVNECNQRWFMGAVVWLEAIVAHNERKSSTHKVVNYNTASRHGEPFEEVIKKYGIPNQKFPHCTRELKLNPIKSYMNWLGYKPSEYLSAIGIRFDEPSRIANNPNFIYPLYNNGTTSADILDFWEKQPFKLNLQPHEGNCDFCWKKSIRKKLQIAKENPAAPEWWAEMEEKYSDGYFFHRGNVSTNDLLRAPAEIQQGIDDEKPCNCRTILTDLL